jgi:Cu/Ag efflux protein CusF
MKTLNILLVAIISIIFTYGHALSQGEGNTFKVGDGFQWTAEVVKVDKKKRKVTLKGKNGKTKSVKIPKGIKGIDKIEKGDILDIEIGYGLAITLAKPGETEGEVVTSAIKNSKEGEKPQTTAIETVEVVGKIQTLDLATRRVTLVGDKGHTVTIMADSTVHNFETLKVGDLVHAKYMEEFAIGFVNKSRLEK